MPAPLYLFVFSAAVFIPGGGGYFSSSGIFECVFELDCDIEDIMDELRRRRALALG